MSRDIEDAFYRLETAVTREPEGRVLEYVKWPTSVGERDVLDEQAAFVNKRDAASI